MRKFICTTIRPTKLPIVDLYEWETCAKFIADYLEYEELDIPDKLPSRIPSPANVLDWQIGDSFDFAIVLCSLLIGVGYNAYVVYGTAPKKITTRDESLEKVPEDTTFRIDGHLDMLEEEDPLIDRDEEHMIVKEKKDEDPKAEFLVKIKEPHSSAFDNEQEEAEAKKKRDAERRAKNIEDDEPDYVKDDPYGR